MHYFALHVLLYLLVCIPALLQAVVQQRIVCLQDNYKVEEALGEELTRVMVNYHAPLLHQILEVVIYLYKYRESNRVNSKTVGTESRQTIISGRAV
jgi:hypothetical protein